jgi:hypothetical protein
MSLQKMPTYEDLIPLQSYSARLFKQAWGSTWDFHKEQLFISTLLSLATVIVQASLDNIFSWTTLLSILVVYVGTFVLNFIVNFLRAPKALHTQLQRQLEGEKQTALGLETKLQSLNTQIVELTGTLQKRGEAIDTLEMQCKFRDEDLAALEAERDSLKSELEEEKAKKTKPTITGKIKGVYSEWWPKPYKNDTERIRFDYHFIINVYMVNHGAVTTIEQFKLTLKSGGHSYDGERERDIHDVKEGEMKWREWGAGTLADLEKSNDAPLEGTRNGWLWFVVTGVPSTEDKSGMELELSVIDKDGTPYKLDTSPQSQWEKNPFLHAARMKKAREWIHEKF